MKLTSEVCQCLILNTWQQAFRHLPPDAMVFLHCECFALAAGNPINWIIADSIWESAAVTPTVVEILPGWELRAAGEGLLHFYHKASANQSRLRSEDHHCHHTLVGDSGSVPTMSNFSLNAGSCCNRQRCNCRPAAQTQSTPPRASLVLGCMA